jgi:catechol 2,3-dioxygenase-like lactoylglutathione lyase family enzyme
MWPSTPTLVPCALERRPALRGRYSSVIIRFSNAIAFVTDVARSKAFYRDVMGIPLVSQFDEFVLFEGVFSIHGGTSLYRQAFDRAAPGGSWSHDNVDFYFVSDNLDADFARVSAGATVVHPIRLNPGGERLFPCLDPDGQLVEIGDGKY